MNSPAKHTPARCQAAILARRWRKAEKQHARILASESEPKGHARHLTPYQWLVREGRALRFAEARWDEYITFRMKHNI